MYVDGRLAAYRAVLAGDDAPEFEVGIAVSVDGRVLLEIGYRDYRGRRRGSARTVRQIGGGAEAVQMPAWRLFWLRRALHLARG